MLPLPTAIPASFTAGDTVAWTRDLPNYPRSAGWLLHYALVGTGSVYTVDAVAGDSADNFAISVPAATTAGWTPGDYSVQEYATLTDGTRNTLGITRVTIGANLAASTGGMDTRGQARRIFDAISAVLEGRATEAELEVQINGRTIKYIPVAELLALRSAMRIEMANNDKANGNGDLSRLYVRFRCG